MPRHPHQVSRLEGFSDAVFGFALTLLVVTLETPRSGAELRELVRGSLPFALMFAMVCWIWWEHNKFFRRYGLQDAWTAFLNAALLFLVLFYVYPLKYLTTSLLGPIVRLRNTPAMEEAQFLMLIYSTGIVLIFGTFLLLYRHAWRQRAVLELSPAEELSLLFGRRAHWLTVSVGLTSIAIALLAGNTPWIAVAGLVYALMGPLHAWNGYRLAKAMDVLDPRR
jgi:uncharacterized membrane protein